MALCTGGVRAQKCARGFVPETSRTCKGPGDSCEKKGAVQAEVFCVVVLGRLVRNRRELRVGGGVRFCYSWPGQIIFGIYACLPAALSGVALAFCALGWGLYFFSRLFLALVGALGGVACHTGTVILWSSSSERALLRELWFGQKGPFLYSGAGALALGQEPDGSAGR